MGGPLGPEKDRRNGLNRHGSQGAFRHKLFCGLNGTNPHTNHLRPLSFGSRLTWTPPTLDPHLCPTPRCQIWTHTFPTPVQKMLQTDPHVRPTQPLWLTCSGTWPVGTTCQQGNQYFAHVLLHVSSGHHVVQLGTRVSVWDPHINLFSIYI